jgi:alkylation response protein AidB-like acyl-CoA dehydrogenase
MDFNFNSEQLQLAESVRRWSDKHYGFAARKAIIASKEGISAQAWADLCELGLLALPVPEAQGGFNGSAVDMMPVMQELGRALLVEPYFATVFGARFLQLAGSQEGLLERVAGGQLRLACALGERQSRHDLSAIASTARAVDGGYVLDGSKTMVLHGAQADMLIVSARLADAAPAGAAGGVAAAPAMALFVLEAGAAGIRRDDYRTIDGMRAADIHFEQVAVAAEARLDAPGLGWILLDAASDYGAALLCFEALGAMDALFAATLEYLKTRKQFGVPIGKFQVLQHRIADMHIEIEQARSLAMLAAVNVDAPDPLLRRRAVSAAKARIGAALTLVGQQAVQLHGGMGVSAELPAAHHFKRLTMIGLSLGDTDHHLARFIGQNGFFPDAEDDRVGV